MRLHAAPKRSESGFDHVVVVVFENRSFDHMLGWLYPAGSEPAGQTFDGLAQGDYSNPGESGEAVPAHMYTRATPGLGQTSLAPPLHACLGIT
ncbi:alkaline phosphatase family protein [Plantibacter auratus]|uniref:alkaline phosphatase family protein n=1 Tax=Plantibacter auratus TaxID=272914 RepID=UPI003D354299